MAEGERQAPQIPSQGQDYVSEEPKGCRQAPRDSEGDPTPAGVPQGYRG